MLIFYPMTLFFAKNRPLPPPLEFSESGLLGYAMAQPIKTNYFIENKSKILFLINECRISADVFFKLHPACHTVLLTMSDSLLKQLSKQLPLNALLESNKDLPILYSLNHPHVTVGYLAHHTLEQFLSLNKADLKSLFTPKLRFLCF